MTVLGVLALPNPLATAHPKRKRRSCAVLGVGVGAVVRNQVGAIAASLCVLYGLEPLLTLIPGIGHAVQEFGLGGLASALSSTDSLHQDAKLLGQAPAALVLASYALAVLLIGVSLFRRRDVTP
jgi:ABC-2 type transport system permease protein